MIMVDVYVPVYEKTYDMEVDEKVSIGLILEEMANVVCQKEMGKINGKADELCLCSYKEQKILSPERCLRDYGIQTGSKLLLL